MIFFKNYILFKKSFVLLIKMKITTCLKVLPLKSFKTQNRMVFYSTHVFKIDWVAF